MKEKIIYNGKYFDRGEAIISSESRGLRFGDGCFETMKVVNGKIALKELHFERLFSSLDILKFEFFRGFNADELEDQILSLVRKNKHENYARVRLTVFRSEGGLFDAANDFPNYTIETFYLDKAIGEFNKNGLVLDVYKDARKAIDSFSHLKSNNFLPYVLAAKWANENKLNDAVLLNSAERIADTTIANVFIVINGVIKTPAITEGCIAGVMRKYLIQCCKKEGIPVEECSVTPDELKNASEVFVTNAIRGIRWVKQIGVAGFSCNVSRLLYDKSVRQLWL